MLEPVRGDDDGAWLSGALALEPSMCAEPIATFRDSTFLSHDGRTMLERVYIQFGVASAEWIGAVQLVDDLVWLLQRHTDERSLCRLEWLLPDLYLRVSIAFDGSRCSSDGQRIRVAALRQLLDSFPQAPGWQRGPGA